MENIYNQYIENTFGEYCQADFKLIQFENNYRQFFPASKNARVLDIGVGRGEMLSCMQAWGYVNYQGIDISVSAVDYCKSIGLNCAHVADTVDWLNNNREKFELITILDVLEHIKRDDLLDFLSAIQRSLKAGGKLIVQVPNLQAPDPCLHRYYDITHESGFTEHSLHQVLMASGFRDYSFSGFEDSITRHPKEKIRFILRAVYWGYVRFTRKVTGNLNPSILHPILFAVAGKQ